MSTAKPAVDETLAAYDALAPSYRDYASKKSAYLEAVDRFVIGHAAKGAASLLDVGAGDGVRGMKLAQSLAIKRVVMCEPSAEMAARCRAAGAAEVWQVPAQALPAGEEKFAVIVCLWNVLGHLPDRATRVAALAGMRGRLAPGGSILFDVNNRHNARAYGWLKVAGRVVIDGVLPDSRRGDVAFDWQIGGRSIPAMGHLFTPAEISGIIGDSGLRIMQRVAVDYSSGACSTLPFAGQLAFQVGI